MYNNKKKGIGLYVSFSFSSFNPKSCFLCLHHQSNLCGFMINKIHWNFTHTWTIYFFYDAEWRFCCFYFLCLYCMLYECLIWHLSLLLPKGSSFVLIFSMFGSLKLGYLWKTLTLFWFFGRRLCSPAHRRQASMPRSFLVKKHHNSLLLWWKQTTRTHTQIYMRGDQQKSNLSQTTGT